MINPFHALTAYMRARSGSRSLIKKKSIQDYYVVYFLYAVKTHTGNSLKTKIKIFFIKNFQGAERPSFSLATNFKHSE